MASVTLPAGVVPVTVPSGLAALSAPERVQRFSADRLDRDMGEHGPLAGVRDGSVDFIAQASVHSGGELTLTDLGQTIDWANDRIRLTVSVEGYGSWGLGVYLPVAPVEQWSGTGRRWRVQLLGLETVLQQSAIREAYALDTGTVVTDAVRAVITAAGETPGAITDSTATLSAPRVWPAGTSRLSIINDLLDSIGYFSLWADGDGQFRAEPYVRPANRTTRWEFTDAPGIYRPEFTREQDTFNVPNEVVATQQGTGDTEGLVAVATNDDPASPYSTVSRGRTLSLPLEGVQAESLAALQVIADRALIDATSPTSIVEIDHLLVPLTHNDAVRFARVPAGIDARHVVTRTTVPLSGTGLAHSILREVVDL